MANILHLADVLLNQPLSKALSDAGHKLLLPGPAGVHTVSSYSAVLVDWDSQYDPATTTAAKRAGIPVVVIANHARKAFLTDQLLAHIYLEKPVDAQEIATAVFDAISRSRVSVMETTQQDLAAD